MSNYTIADLEQKIEKARALVGATGGRKGWASLEVMKDIYKDAVILRDRGDLQTMQLAVNEGCSKYGQILQATRG